MLQVCNCSFAGVDVLQERASAQHISDKQITVIKIYNLTSITKKGDRKISTCLHIQLESTQYSLKACTTRDVWMSSLLKRILTCCETIQKGPQGDASYLLIKALKSAPLLFNPLSLLVSIYMQFSFQEKRKPGLNLRKTIKYSQNKPHVQRQSPSCSLPFIPDFCQIRF